MSKTDKDLARLVSKGLTGERYAVNVAADGEQGLQPATDYTYCLLALGIMLPVPDGVTSYRRFLAAGTSVALKSLFLPLP